MFIRFSSKELTTGAALLFVILGVVAMITGLGQGDEGYDDDLEFGDAYEYDDAYEPEGTYDDLYEYDDQGEYYEQV